MHRLPIGMIPLSLVFVLVLSACSLPVDPSAIGDTAVAQVEEQVASSSAESAPALVAEILPAEDPPSSLTRSQWVTDFSQRTVEWEEILSGGPPKDGIPAVDTPSFESIDAASEWLSDRDPVIVFEHDGVARAYPLAILIWHEIVNDELAGKPVSVTFCPLCNASIVFDREFDGEILDFGTTGLLRNSDLVMYDRQSETWWQQFTGQGIVGEYAGRQLDFLPSQVISFGDFVAEFPESDVLARPPVGRSYGANPYTNYDSIQGRPFLYTGELDERLPSTERVVGIDAGDDVMAYPFSAVEEVGAINDEIGETPIVVFHKSGTASALDTRQIAEGKDVGSVAVFDRRLGDQTLTFESNGDGTFSDVETGSTWNILGEAIDGELAGEELEQVLAFDHFWFAWSAFFPDTGLYSG